jgi:hypothetical protein
MLRSGSAILEIAARGVAQASIWQLLGAGVNAAARGAAPYSTSAFAAAAQPALATDPLQVCNGGCVQIHMLPPCA